MRKELEQGTPEWLEMRKKHITATDAMVIMGESPKTPLTLWKQKKGLLPPDEESYPMRRGKQLEPIALASYEKLVYSQMFPDVVFHKEHPWMMASLDGMSLDGNYFVEIKCPMKFDSTKDYVKQYYPQLQHQIACTCHQYMDLYVYDGETGNGKNFTVERNPPYIDKLIQKEKAFYDSLVNGVEPGASDSDILHVDDEQMVHFAEELIEIKQKIDVLQERKGILEKFLKEKGPENDFVCGGLKIARHKRKGSIDYKAIPELKNVDTEQYRKPDSVYWTFKEFREKD